MRFKKFIVAMTILSLLGLSSDIDDAQQKENLPKEVNIVKSVEEIPTEIININSELYGGYIEEIKDDLLKKVRKNNSSVSMDIIDLAFESANNRKDFDSCSVKEYFTLVALNLAIMETESNFDNSVIGHNETTIDYGIMQINSSAINYIKDGLNNPNLNVNNLEDNIEMGSFEVFECYSKAKEKHPNNILWWTYAYYNRGLYFEKYDYDYNQANTRSKIFIKKFNKYFKILYNN